METLYCQCDAAEDVFRRDGRAWTGFDLKTYLRRTERAGIWCTALPFCRPDPFEIQVKKRSATIIAITLSDAWPSSFRR